ncbi:MAG: hypothetical protein N2595_06000 [bacterium]|nr:hypothetical protein [bacterium]
MSTNCSIAQLVRMDASFMGNDFGTQTGLLMSPAVFRAFFRPWNARFAAQAHAHGYVLAPHSCGAISEHIDEPTAAGVDCQRHMLTRAKGMVPADQAARFGSRLVFMGGVDTQDLLVHSTSAEVTAALRELRRACAERIIVGPSHKAMLPNTQPANVVAMVAATRVPLASDPVAHHGLKKRTFSDVVKNQ